MTSLAQEGNAHTISLRLKPSVSHLGGGKVVREHKKEGKVKKSVLAEETG